MTGVQTCALPIFGRAAAVLREGFPSVEAVRAGIKLMTEPLIRRLLPMDVHAAELYGDAPSELLYPEENAHISRAVAKRRNEFTAVRHCARIALAELGLVRPPLVPGEAGAPT